MLPPAARLIEHESDFAQGTLYRDFMGYPTGPNNAVTYDCLGAIFAAYKHTDVENRHAAAKRVFDACKARYDHKMLGKLTWEQAFELLRDCGA